MNEFIKMMEERRSIRRFKPDMPPKAELEQIIEAGLYAPSAKNSQPTLTLAITNKELRDRISNANRKIGGWDEGFDPFYGAPTAVLVLGEKNNPNGVQDASLVMGNLLLAAPGIGLGSCWINRAKETFETPEGKALLAKWGLDPEKYIGVGYCILGYPAPNGTRTPGPRKAGYVLHV